MNAYNKTSGAELASLILAGGALFLILRFGLLGALFPGLLVYSLVHVLAPALGKRINNHRANMLAVAVLGASIVAVLAASAWAIDSFFRSDAGSLQALLQRMADIIDASRSQVPEWLRERLPEDSESLRIMLANWLREHAIEAKALGEQAGRGVIHLLIGMVIGAMAALHDTTGILDTRPLAAALHERVVRLNKAFRNIVFAQVRIAAINAALTGLYLFVLLPLAGIHLPLGKTLIVITFFAGMLPVIGNIISNTVLVVIALSHSLHTALISLAFLITIHKMEYFLNARIIGSQINARAWELLAAMLAMETLFGIEGVIAAPVFYAYVKNELSERGLV